MKRLYLILSGIIFTACGGGNQESPEMKKYVEQKMKEAKLDIESGFAKPYRNV